MRTILVTGGIGSGKTLVCSLLGKRGMPVFDCDSRAKALYDDVAFCREVDAALGGGLLVGNHLSLAALSQRVFSSPDLLAVLESMVFPRVTEDFRIWRAMKSEEAVVVESAVAYKAPDLLAEADLVIEVVAPVDVRVARACSRDSVSADEVRKRMENQSAEHIDGAVVLVNDSGIEELENKLNRIL